jgi:hypothetical protein
MLEVPSGDDILGRAVRFLLDGGDDKAAAMLLQCDLEVEVVRIYETDPWLPNRLSVAYVVGSPRDAGTPLTPPDRPTPVRSLAAYLRSSARSLSIKSLRARHISSKRAAPIRLA